MSKLSQLSQVLVDKYGLDQQEANDFVSNMFTVIRERILTDHSVKIKGLGTFKLAEMSARESIDVNTGDRITIEGRYKLSFTPENSVRDRINSPFSHFESIDIDDKVDVSKLMETVLPDVDTADFSEVPESIPAPEPTFENTETTTSTPQEEPVAEVIPTEEEVQTVNEEEMVGEGQTDEEGNTVEEEQPAAELLVVEEQQTAEDENAEEEPVAVVQPTSAEEPAIEEQPVSVEPNTAEPLLPKTRSPFCEELIRENINRSRTIMTMLRWLIGLIAVLLICVGMFFVYNLGKQAGRGVSEMNAEEIRKAMQKDDIPDVTFEPIVVINENPDSAIAEIVSKVKSSLESKANKQHKDAHKEEAKPAAPQEAQPAAKQEVKPAAQESKPAIKPATPNPSRTAKAEAAKQEQYNKDPRVRTGAYVIIGVDTVVTVKQGQTLQSISKAFLGEGMECYVEAINGGITSVKPGDKLKIPKVIHKKQLKNKN